MVGRDRRLEGAALDGEQRRLANARVGAAVLLACGALKFGEALGRLARIDSETLVIALSAGRPHALVVRAMKLAHHRQAATIAITDATMSDVAKLAQIKLYYSSNSPTYVRSHTALLSMIQALAYGVYSRDEEQYVDRIKAFRLK